jgi:FkbM family methyltransferase
LVDSPTLFSKTLHEVLLRVSQRATMRALMTPLLRSYLRYFPVPAGKVRVWREGVEPYFAWASHPFLANTKFGSRVGGDTQDMVQQYIYYFGVWEPALTAWIQRRLKPGDTFVDVGANIGYYTLLASKLVGASGRVVALEASRFVFTHLMENLRRNRVSNVRPVNVAVTDRQEETPMFRGRNHNIGETSLLQVEGSIPDGVASAAPLTNLLRPEEVATARIIKLDIEGAEWRAVSGMLPLLDSLPHNVDVVVEVHPWHMKSQSQDPEALISLLADAGFKPYEIDNDYSAERYLTKELPSRPVRLRHPIRQESMLVFSRADSETL